MTLNKSIFDFQHDFFEERMTKHEMILTGAVRQLLQNNLHCQSHVHRDKTRSRVCQFEVVHQLSVKNVDFRVPGSCRRLDDNSEYSDEVFIFPGLDTFGNSELSFSADLGGGGLK